MIVFDGLGESRRKIHDDVARPKCEIHIVEAFERGLELLDAFLYGNVERGQRTRGDGSRGRKAVARLKTLQCLGDIIVKRSGCLVGGKIAADQKTLAQQIVMRSRHAGCEFGLGGDDKPSAAHRQIRIAQRRFLDPLRGAFVECRLVRQRQCRRGSRFGGRCGRCRFCRGGMRRIGCNRWRRCDRLGRDR
jgi:hypothetical protein